MWGAGPKGSVTREPASSASCLLGSGTDERETSSPPSSFTIHDGQEMNGKTGHGPHLLQHSEEQALCLTLGNRTELALLCGVAASPEDMKAGGLTRRADHL